MSLYHGWDAVLFSVVILGSYTQTRTLRLLETPTLVYLGEISFSLYLLHIPVRGLFEFGSKVIAPLAHLREAAPVIYAGSIILSSGMMAAFCYRFVEEPWRKRLRSLFSPPPSKVIRVESIQEAA